MNGMVTRQARALLLAVQFLTVLPVPRRLAADDASVGQSLLWYPAVGLLLGVLLTLGCALLPLPYALQAVLGNSHAALEGPMPGVYEDAVAVTAAAGLPKTTVGSAAYTGGLLAVRATPRRTPACRLALSQSGMSATP